VAGRLVATKPIGSPCHDPTFDAAACDALKANWFNPLTQYVFSSRLEEEQWLTLACSIPSSSSVMQTYFANQSCDPFTDRTIPCTLGNYVSYAVEATSNADVAAALKFAKDNKLRVVVRNTGHE
jgi:hypothetical protein